MSSRLLLGAGCDPFVWALQSQVRPSGPDCSGRPVITSQSPDRGGCPRKFYSATELVEIVCLVLASCLSDFFTLPVLLGSASPYWPAAKARTLHL